MKIKLAAWACQSQKIRGLVDVVCRCSYQWTCCEWSESEEAVYSNVGGG